MFSVCQSEKLHPKGRKKRKGNYKSFKLREMKVELHRTWKMCKKIYREDRKSVLQIFWKDIWLLKSEDGHILRCGMQCVRAWKL